MKKIIRRNDTTPTEQGVDGRPDLAGFGRAYQNFFGTKDQPNLHARSRIQIAKLMNPAWLVEIEVVAAKI